MDIEWNRRLDLERRLGNLTATHCLVLSAIALDIALGYPEPSEARIMSQSGVSRSSVQRAKARGRALGLLEWARRFHRGPYRREELPCAYRATMPTRPARREHQREARTRTTIQRSVSQQLNSLPVPTEFQKRLWEERKAGMNNRIQPVNVSGLTYSTHKAYTGNTVATRVIPERPPAGHSSGAGWHVPPLEADPLALPKAGTAIEVMRAARWAAFSPASRCV